MGPQSSGGKCAVEKAFVLNLESCRSVYHEKRGSKGKSGTVDCVTNLEEKCWNLGSWFKCREHTKELLWEGWRDSQESDWGASHAVS